MASNGKPNWLPLPLFSLRRIFEHDLQATALLFKMLFNTKSHYAYSGRLLPNQQSK